MTDVLAYVVMLYIAIILDYITLTNPSLLTFILSQALLDMQSARNLTITLTTCVCVSYETPVNPLVGCNSEKLMLDMAGMKRQLSNVSHLILATDTLLMLIFRSVHFSIENHLLYLNKVVPSVLSVTLDTNITGLATCGYFFSFDDVFPLGHLLI
jgi:hypothetical protein